MSTNRLQLLILTVSGWVNRNQQDAIDYLQEANRILREHVGDRHLRFTDSQRRRLAANGIEPTSTRRKGTSWEMFLKLHWGAIAAADFFTVEALTHVGQTGRGRVACRERLGGLLRYYYRQAA